MKGCSSRLDYTACTATPPRRRLPLECAAPTPSCPAVSLPQLPHGSLVTKGFPEVLGDHIRSAPRCHMTADTWRSRHDTPPGTGADATELPRYAEQARLYARRWPASGGQCIRSVPRFHLAGIWRTRQDAPPGRGADASDTRQLYSSGCMRFCGERALCLWPSPPELLNL